MLFRSGSPEPETAQADQTARSQWLAARRRDAHWARQYAMPWVRRRLAGAESDSTDPKRPTLLPLNPADPPNSVNPGDLRQ